MSTKVKPIRPILPSLDIYLVRDQEDIWKIKEIRDYPFPDMGNALAKCSHVNHTTRNIEAIIISFPSIMDVEPILATCTLVHEACHAWDYIKEAYGFTHADSELHAYSVESIFAQLYEVYAAWMRKEGRI